MEHEAAEALFSDYVDGELALAERTALDEHLAGCDRCRAELVTFRRTVDSMRSAPHVTPSPEFMDELRSQIRTRSRGRFFGERKRSYRLEIASLVSLGIVIAIYLLCSIAQPLLLAP